MQLSHIKKGLAQLHGFLVGNMCIEKIARNSLGRLLIVLCICRPTIFSRLTVEFIKGPQSGDNPEVSQLMPSDNVGTRRRSHLVQVQQVISTK